MLLANVRGRSQLREQRIPEDFSRVINALGGWRYPIQSTPTKANRQQDYCNEEGTPKTKPPTAIPIPKGEKLLPRRIRETRSFTLASEFDI